MTKICRVCQEEKPITEFKKRKAGKHGVDTRCKPCTNAYLRELRKRDPDTNQKQREYRSTCPEKQREYCQSWVENNRDKKRALIAKYRAAKLQRIPDWANIEVISNVYELCELITEVAGEPYHVDHIVPLQGENVSGLHVEYNLQIIPARENLAKGNTFKGEKHNG